MQYKTVQVISQYYIDLQVAVMCHEMQLCVRKYYELLSTVVNIA